MIFVSYFFGRQLALKSSEMMKGGAMAEVVYVATSRSHFGPGSSKDSSWKMPAVMKTVESWVPESAEAMDEPQFDCIRSILGIHLMFEGVSEGESLREVA